MGRFTSNSAIANPDPSAVQALPPSSAINSAPTSGPTERKRTMGLLDAKIRVHNRLIDELDLSSLEKLDDIDLKRQVRAIVMLLDHDGSVAVRGICGA